MRRHLQGAAGRVAGASILAGCLLGSILPASALAEVPEVVGFNSVTQFQHLGHREHPITLSQIEDEDQMVAEAGAGVIRVNVSWKALQPAGPGSFNETAASKLDDVFRTAAEAEPALKIDAVVVHTPCWASSTPFKVLGSCSADPYDDAYPPTYSIDFGRFIERLTSRQTATVDYGETLAAVEIWNEANWGPLMLRGPNPKVAYNNMVHAASQYRQNNVPIWAGSLHYLGDSSTPGQPDPATGGPAWTEALLNYGIANHIDGWSVHAYDPQQVAGVLAKIEVYRQKFVDHGAANVPFAVTEFGWRTHGNGAPTPETLARQVQATRLVAGFEAIEQLNADPDRNHISHALAFKLRDLAEAAENQFSKGYGVLETDFDDKCAYGSLKDLFLLGDNSVSCPP